MDDFSQLLLEFGHVSSIRVLPRRHSTVLVLLCQQNSSNRNQSFQRNKRSGCRAILKHDRYEQHHHEGKLKIAPAAHARGQNLAETNVWWKHRLYGLNSLAFKRYKVYKPNRIQHKSCQADDGIAETGRPSYKQKLSRSRSGSSEKQVKSLLALHMCKRLRRICKRLRQQLLCCATEHETDLKQSSMSLPVLPEKVEEMSRVQGNMDYSDALRRFKTDVFISHHEDDLEFALQFIKLFEQHGLSCILGERDFLPGTFKSDAITEAMMTSKRVVLLLSRKFLQTGWCKFELQMSLSEMFESKRALVVPVLLDVTEAEVPPCLRNLSCVEMHRDPNHMEKLILLLRGPEVTVGEMMPAGNVSYGLGWNYFFYLQIILPDIAKRVHSFCNQNNPRLKDTRMPRKLYILVPASCFCPSSLESEDREGRIRFGDHLEDVRRSTAGSVGRVYKHTVWNIHKKNGEVLQFVGEYCNVIKTLYDLENKRNAGVDSRQRLLQRDQLSEQLQTILDSHGLQNHARIVAFKDTDKEGNTVPLSEILEPLVERDRLAATVDHCPPLDLSP